MGLIESLEALLNKGSDNALLRYGLGNEYLKQGQHEQALAHLRRAIAFDPNYSAAWKLLAQALAGAGHRQEAIDAYESGIAIAEQKGDVQAAKEMRVFLKRLTKPQE